MAAPYLLVLQHHILDSRTRVIAPLVPSVTPTGTLLAPHIPVGRLVYRVMLLDHTAIPIALLAEIVDAPRVDDAVISAGLDAIFRGYPVEITTP
jgi:hypothetical protein